MQLKKAKNIIQRAKQNLPLVDQYDIKYVKDFIQYHEADYFRERNSAEQLYALPRYMDKLMLFAEGVRFSNRIDVA